MTRSTPGQIQAVLGGNSVSAVQTVDGESVLVEARPTRNGGIVMVQPQAEAVAVGQVAVRRLTLALLIACGIAVVLGLIVSWRLALPLKRTAAAAHSLAAGERDVVVRPDGPVEVAEVAEALNSLGSGLARSEARQRDFLLSVSHDLRTPLTAITGYAESLADGMIDPDQVPRAGAVMLAEAQRLDRFVADLLDLARLDAREVRVDLADVDLVHVIDGAASVWSARCAGEGVPLTVERPPGELWVRTDAARLRQALDGLLENALRVVPPGRPIVLAGRSEMGPGGQSVAVAEIRDGGPGLTEADLAVAFDRSALYERYKGVRKVGTGLGLAIVHQLVRRLGGTVEAGHAPEGGARFTVRLPAGAGPPGRAGNLARRRHRGQAVDALGVLLAPVGPDAVGALAVGPLVHLRPVAAELHHRNAVPARVGDPGDVHHDDRTDADRHVGGKAGGQGREFGIVEKYRPGSTVQTDNAGRSFEGAEHDDYAAVLVHMGDGLGSAAGLIHITDPMAAQHRELTAIALGRAVDVAITREGSRGDEEDRLRCEPLGQPGVDAVIDPSHPDQYGGERYPAGFAGP